MLDTHEVLDTHVNCWTPMNCWAPMNARERLDPHPTGSLWAPEETGAALVAGAGSHILDTHTLICG
jgi:hypothetical protein